MGKRDVLVLAGILLVLVILFLPTLMKPGRICLGRPEGDARNQFYGWRAYGFGEIRAGRFPLWNPYELLGMPFVASLQSGMFYPTNWLCAVLPLGRAINLGILINLFLSALFAYLWTRRLQVGRAGAVIAAAAYTLGAPQFMRIFEGHWSFLAMMPWIPCILLCTEHLVIGKWRLWAMLGGAAAVTMQWFGGNPQYAFYGGITAILYLAFRCWQLSRDDLRNILKAAACFAGMYLLGTAMAGVQLIPALELLGLSARQGQLTYEWVGGHSLTPESLISFLVPHFFGSEKLQTYWGRSNGWEMSVYVGVVTAGLALIGILAGKRKSVRLAGVIAAVLMVLALGRYTPLLEVLYYTVPGFGLFRAQARFLCPFSLFLGLLAGIGVDALLAARSKEKLPQESSGENRAGRWRAAVWVLGVGAAVLMLAGLASRPGWSVAERIWSWVVTHAGKLEYGRNPLVKLPTPAAAMKEAGFSMLRSGVLIALLVFLIFLLRRTRIPAKWAAVAIVGLVAADLLTFSARYVETFDPNEDGLTPGVIKTLKADPQPFRYFRGGDFLYPHCEGMTHRFCCIEGIQPNVPSRFRDLFRTFQGQDKTAQETSYSMKGLFPPFRMLNLRYLVQRCTAERPEIEGNKTLYEDERMRVEMLANTWPRAWLVHEYGVVPDSDRVLSDLKRVNYEQCVLFEEEPREKVSPSLVEEDEPRFVAYEPSRVVLEVEAAAPAFLVMSDLHYPGWHATVDGKKAVIHRGNYLMRVVRVPAGRHTVQFEYRPASFKAGIALSIFGFLVAAALLVMGLFERKRMKGLGES